MAGQCNAPVKGLMLSIGGDIDAGNNLAWNEIKEWATWTAKNAQLEAIGTSVLLPILECVFVNLYTSATRTGTPLIVAIIGLAHFMRFSFSSFSFGKTPIQ